MRPPASKRIWARALFLVLAMILCAGSVDSQGPGERKRILLLFTHESHLPAQVTLERSIRSTLESGSPVPVEIYSEYLDAVRTNIDDYEQALVSQLHRKYGGKKFDLLLAINPPALKVLLKNRSTLFSETPIVYLLLDQGNLSDIDPSPNMTGVWGDSDYGPNLELALSLNPGTKRVVVISGVSEWDKYWRARVQNEFRAFENKVEFTYLIGLGPPELQNTLAALPPQTIVIFVSSVQDNAGNNYGNLEVLRRIAPVSSAPVYGISDVQLGLGIVGGKLLSFETLGAGGARVGLRVLAGEKPDAIPPHGVASVPMFDWRQLQRWGISESALPEGSIIQFREQTFWEEYRGIAFGLLGAIVVETLLIAWLLFLRRRKQQAENENRDLHGRLSEIVSNVPGIVWESRIDPVTNLRRTTFVSDYIKKMLGYSPEEWLKKPPGFGVKIMPAEDRVWGREESEAVIRSGKDAVSEYRWVTRDGRTIWVENHLSPIFGLEGKVVGLRGVALDVTNRKLAEEKARDAEEKDKALLAAIPDLMFLQTLDGVYLDYHAVNPTDLLVPPEEFLGKNNRDVLPPDLAEQFTHCFERAEEGAAPQILEYSVELGDGERWFEARMVRSGDKILSIVRDITDLKRKTQEALELTGRLITVQEDERARLARELHDGISQNLALLSIELAMFARRQEYDQESVDAEMTRLSSRVGELSGELRRISQELHPAKLEQLGLVAAVRGFCNEVAEAHELSVEFEEKNVPSSIPDVASLCLYRIAQEALQNVVKHSGAKRVQVKISSNGDGLRLGITDDGNGFDAKTTTTNGALGLVSMRERIRLLNGKISIVSRPGEGTQIEATVPV